VNIKTRLTRLANGLGTRFFWAIAVVRETLPNSVRIFGSRPRAQLFKLDPEGELESAGILYKSFLGEPRIGPDGGHVRITRAILALDDSAQYRRRLTLSHEAFRRGRSALELRLNELSPLPPGDVVFDYQVQSSSSSNAGVDVEIAIARRNQVEQISGMLGGTGKRWSIVGDIENNGAVRFHFLQNEDSPNLPRSMGFVRPLLLLLAIVFASFTWIDRSAREYEALQTRRLELLQSVRQLRDVGGLIATADRAAEAEEDAPYLTSVFETIQTTMEDGRADFDIAQINMSQPDELTIWGFARNDDGELVRVETSSRIGGNQ
jgi:hypothetical protein